MTKNKAETTLFYDGACHLCSREAAHYRRLLPEDKLALINIAAENFDAAAHGLDAKAVNRTMHAQKAGGEVVTGIDAFALIWQQLPRYAWLATMTRTPGIRQSMLAGYAVIAKLRPWLPKRRACATSC